LLHISDVNQLRGHPQWGALFETWCVGEVIKARLNRGLPPDCWFWRSSDGYEVDLVLERGEQMVPIEIKAGETPYPRHAAPIRKLRELSERDPSCSVPPGLVIYGGDDSRPCEQDRFVPWFAIDDAMDGLT
jgi:predicted AAA+ superfamily ATPase